jgi:hypothetical protein
MGGVQNFSCTFIALWSSASLSQSGGHFQGDFLVNNNTVVIKMSLSNSKYDFWLKFIVE